MTELLSEFDRRLADVPVIAILRGVQPHEAEAIGSAIVDAGISVIEVPLNSPDPFASIAVLARTLGARAIIGAGTVLTVDQVSQALDSGAKLIVSPNTDPRVIAHSRSVGLLSAPGCLTPTEAFAALEAGAHMIKLFPGEMVTPAAIKAMRAVVPPGIRIHVVGGVTPEIVPIFQSAGVDGFGVGSAIYRAGTSAADAGRNAAAFTKIIRRYA